ncbi:MAG: glycosyltransferase family 4 protein, partial [Clostridia bacterium]|nr:glycosyltransferase family 4 protein [Clostridia bacterium]
MRILMAASFNYPHAGGLSTHMSMLARALTQASHEVDIASFSDLPAYLRLLGVQGPSFLLNRWRRGLGMVVSHRARRRLLAGVIQRRLPADVINAEDVFAALAARKAASAASAPVVLTLHGYMAWEAVSKGSIAAGSPAEKFFLDMEDQAYREADRIITVDTRLANYVKDRVGRTEGVTVIPNFIDLDSFDPLRLREAQARQAGQGWREKLRKRYGLPPDAYILFCPRRLTEKNGVIYPLLALPSLLALHPDYFLVYAGEGEERRSLEEAIRRDRLSDHVRLLGALGRDAIEELYAVSDLVLVPSVTSAGVEEATSIAALEGMAAGLPVVASSIGGLKELIQPEKTGWLVPQRDVAALSRAINTLREQPELAASIGQAARRYVEAHHSSQAAAQRFLEVYQSAIEDRRSQGQGGLGLVAHLQAPAPEIPSASAPAQVAAPSVAPALAPPATAPAPAPSPVPAPVPG